MTITKEKAASLLEDILQINYLCDGVVIGECYQCANDGDKVCEKALALTMTIELLRDEKTCHKGNDMIYGRMIGQVENQIKTYSKEEE